MLILSDDRQRLGPMGAGPVRGGGGKRGYLPWTSNNWGIVVIELTSFGQYCFTKLPFGISSGPELFQKRMSQILSGLDGVVCLIDDILVTGKDTKEHDERLLAVLQRIRDARVTLNREKCVFHPSSVKFLGHIVEEGIHADPEKTEAIQQMKAPDNVTEL